MKSCRYLHKLTVIMLLVLFVLAIGCITSQASKPEDGTSVSPVISGENIPGKVYTFDSNNTYQFSSSLEYMDSVDTETYGTFNISGTDMPIKYIGEKNGVPAYSVTDGHIAIQYSYSDKYSNAPDEEWHLVEDNVSSVDVFTINSNIQKGALILQTSLDRINWYNASVQANAFINAPIQNGVLYETTDIEMINGCYYRLLVVYELAIKTGTSTVWVFFSKDDYEYMRVAEVYEFYAENTNEHIGELDSQTIRYSLGETVLVSDFASYSGAKDISKEDLHYGWELGNFFVSGFTSKTDYNGNTVFLKNVGDVVTLWFNLKQNINALNNDGDLTITPDGAGHDQYFQTPTTYFGRGMLIIRYTDHENIKHNPVMYYDYLVANTKIGANTRVQLFEEGDYEVALDYEVHKGSQTHHYRIFFKFSVRNANCMIFPFDILTGAELINCAVAPNGFYLDLARSRYLDIYIKKEIWAEGADGLTEDTRFNTTAKDGNQYLDDGIYTITVKNQYTGLATTKKIYVGTNRILVAYMNSNYSIAEIQSLIEQGAIIYEDGTIVMPNEPRAFEPAYYVPGETVEIPSQVTDNAGTMDEQKYKVSTQSENIVAEEIADDNIENQHNTSFTTILAIFAPFLIAVVILFYTRIVKKQNSKEEEK